MAIFDMGYLFPKQTALKLRVSMSKLQADTVHMKDAATRQLIHEEMYNMWEKVRVFEALGEST